MASTPLNRVLTSLIDKSVEHFEMTRKIVPAHQKLSPCITISRETGSGGRLIARLIAGKLKMKFYDKELVEMISQNAAKRKNLVESLDEKTRGIIEEIIDSLKPQKEKLSELSYFNYLCQTILSLVKKGRAVILGRGGNFIIPSSRCLRVRICAPFTVRVANSMKFEKRSLSQALREVRKIHQQRKEFIKRYFFKDDSNANYYDLVVNTQDISIPKAVSIIIRAFREKFG